MLERPGIGESRCVDCLANDCSFLSETKLYGGWAEGIRRHVNFQNSFHVDCVGKSGGLLLLWNEDWEVSVKSFSVGHIDALVQCPGKRQGAAHVQERLDRFCCNQDWHNLFPSVRVINGDLLHSDHRPVVATLENVVRVQKNDKKRCFRFETHWLKDEECHDIVNHTWLEPDVPLDSQDSILDIFGRCAERLGAWNKDKFGSIPRRVRETQKQLDELLSVAAQLYFGTIFSSASPSVQQVENGITNIEARNSVLFGKKQSRLDVIDMLAKEALEEFQGVRASCDGRVLGAAVTGEVRLGVGGGGVGQGRLGRGGARVGGGRWCSPGVATYIF
ncbi:hypothetical protein G4B88_009204 [Cannabis sativa]|uniref:Uncharacterized protein n=1 Tax=Cannabis sativa TaxID=3483 RepID=A0A7J6G362_CANSA|nr:hypothetical protein G4B88_009204 [Cannabis sativa]